MNDPGGFLSALADAARRQDAAAWGAVGLSRLDAFLPSDGRMRARFDELKKTARSAVVVAFPFYAGEEPGNIALYARGKDYYTANGHRLAAMAEELLLTAGYVFRTLKNGYPLPIVNAARLAGLGTVGAHGMLICPPYGSHVVLGALVTEEVLTEGTDAGFCPQCGACVEACPTGALTLEPGGQRTFDRTRCLASISQSREITHEEEALLPCGDRIWGCDVCQLACPGNKNPARSALPEFSGDLVRHLTEDDLSADGAYTDRAFAREGMDILRRNLSLMHDKK